MSGINGAHQLTIWIIGSTMMVTVEKNKNLLQFILKVGK